MNPTQAQREAQDNLQKAIQEHIEAWRDEPVNEVLVDWMLISQLTSFDDDGDTTDAYHLAFVNGSLSDHRAYGLLALADHHLKFGGHPD